jgi:putative membrane protein insertion efficiency factor
MTAGDTKGIGSRVRAIVRAIVIAPITVYQRVISPAIPRRCKYEPTCSRYAVEAIRRHGVLKGVLLAGWRLLRCNPFSYGGYDPVDAQRLFKTDHHAHQL